MKSGATISVVFLAAVYPLLLCLLGGCGGQSAATDELTLDSWSNEPIVQAGWDPSERVVDYYIRERGQPHAYCIDFVQSVPIHTVPDAHETCGPGTAGCNKYGNTVIFIDERYADSEDLKTHELMHAFLSCQLGYPDPDHVENVWQHIPVNWSTR